MPTKTIKQKINIPATPAQLYEVFTNPQIHSLVTGSKATGGTKVGQKFTAWDGYITGKVLQLKKNSLVKQEWQTDGWEIGYGPSILELRFEAKSKGTQITLIHSNVPSASASSYAQGWHDYYWKPLITYFTDHAEYKAEQERQAAKEQALLIALKKNMALMRRELEIHALKKDGSTILISKSKDYEHLWQDALKALRKR